MNRIHRQVISSITTALTTEIVRKERWISNLIRGIKKRNQRIEELSKDNARLRTLNKNLKTQVFGYKGGTEQLKTLAHQRRKVLEELSYISEEVSSPSVSCDKIESVARTAINWS